MYNGFIKQDLTGAFELSEAPYSEVNCAKWTNVGLISLRIGSRGELGRESNRYIGIEVVVAFVDLHVSHPIAFVLSSPPESNAILSSSCILHTPRTHAADGLNRHLSRS